MIDVEEWRPIPRFDGCYEASSHGRIRSIPRRNTKGGIMALNGPNEAIPYAFVILCKDGIKATRFVHSLVLTAFRGEREPGMVASHLDGDAANNRIGNLIWESQQENLFRQRQHGTAPVGEGNPRAILTEVQVLEIRGDKKLTTTQMMEKYGVCRSAINRAKNGRAWAHV